MVYRIFMQFQRIQTVEAAIRPRRVLVIYGPRRVGKTTLLKAYLNGLNSGSKKIIGLIGDDFKLRALFKAEIRDDLLDFARDADVIAIDEAQQLPSVGLGIKMIIDAMPEKNIILTGSSSFDLSQNLGEPLTGRHFTMTLLPIAQCEMTASKFELKNALEHFLLYGSYPEILTTESIQEKKALLTELVSSYLLKDALALEALKYPDSLLDILRALAYQIGNEVSLNEIAQLVRLDGKTVARYLDLLEKMFVIKKVRGYSRNARNEMVKKAKYYFLDLGVRNAIISQFNPLPLRNDVGQLWENFIFMELYKKSVLNRDFAQLFFWRTHAQQELDIVIEKDGILEVYECKWTDRKTKHAKAFQELYPNSKITVVNRENYLDVLL